MVPAEQWARIRDRLRAEYGERAFECWLKPLTLAESRRGQARIAAPTPVIRDFVDSNYRQRMAELWREAGTGIDRVEIIVLPRPLRGAAGPAAHPAVVPPPVEKQRVDPVAPAETALIERFNFDSFVVGASNELAHRAALRVAESDRPEFNPLFLYGGVGLGKTHLMHAIGWRQRQRRPDRRVLYLRAEHFMNRFVRALRDRTTAEFKDQLRSAELLLIDDLQFIPKGGPIQDEFFHTLNALMDGGRQVVVSADKPLLDLEGVGDRLRSRLSGGMIVEIEPTDYAMRLAILQTKTRGHAETVDPKVLEYIARSVQGNVRDLEGALTTVLVRCQMTDQPVTVERAHEYLRDRVKQSDRKITIEEIQKRVAEYYKVRVADLRSERRSKNIVRPRHLAMYFAKQLTTRSLPEIGRMFGNRDHTTVIHGVRRIEELSEKDPKLKDDIETLRRQLDP